MGADKSWYWFGEHNADDWKSLFDQYKVVKYITDSSPDALSYSFGLAGDGSGVPFHIHGHVFAETLRGAKRWILSPPGKAPKFDPNVTSLSWYHNVRPMLKMSFY